MIKIPVDVNPNTIRIRQKPPTGYVRYRIKDFGNGIKAVIGFKKGGGSEVQSYIFDKKRWDLAKAKAWVAKHKAESNEGFYIVEFAAPIEAYSSEFQTEKDFWIQGTAINETITRNGVKYTAEELEPAATSLKEKPILKDHRNEVDAIVGKVTDSFFDKNGRRIAFKGKIMDENIRKLIKDGRLTNVSIGARVKELEEGEGFRTAKGISFLELSLVPVPGDPDASFHQALSECFLDESDIVCEETFDLFETENVNENKTSEKEVIDTRTKEAGFSEKESKEAELPSKSFEEVNKMTEEIKTDEKVKELSGQLEAKDAALKEAEKKLAEIVEKEHLRLVETYRKLAEEKKIKAIDNAEKLSEKELTLLIETLKGVTIKEEDDEDEEEKEEEKMKQTTKGTIAEEKTEAIKTDLIVEASNEGISFCKMPNEKGRYGEVK